MTFAKALMPPYINVFVKSPVPITVMNSVNAAVNSMTISDVVSAVRD